MSWATYAPGVKESAGKRKGSGSTGHGNPYDTRIGPERAKRNHLRQLEALGYKVTLEPAA
ncbi:MAG TPA: hypothetical protein VK942_08230 [Actinomycetes bacterium]|nr:hypothetical protein [Actinomycetes bacterium]